MVLTEIPFSRQYFWPVKNVYVGGEDASVGKALAAQIRGPAFLHSSTH